MADSSLLIPCGANVSRQAAACPRCGHPDARIERRTPVIVVVLVRVAVALVAVHFTHLSNGSMAP
jgi:hypothetical protein